MKSFALLTILSFAGSLLQASAIPTANWEGDYALESSLDERGYVHDHHDHLKGGIVTDHEHDDDDDHLLQRDTDIVSDLLPRAAIKPQKPKKVVKNSTTKKPTTKKPTTKKPPPTIPILPKPVLPSKTAALASLAGLTVRTAANPAGIAAYDRADFPHWSQSGGCTTRELALRRDAVKNSVIGASTGCKILKGKWFSEYDGKTVVKALEIDIDHVVPLKDAWVSGAYKWTQAQRKAFANDLTSLELLAVGGSINKAKGDRIPGIWWPVGLSKRCDFAKRWVTVKAANKLSITAAEQAALTGELQLASCV